MTRATMPHTIEATAVPLPPPSGGGAAAGPASRWLPATGVGSGST